MKFAVALYHGEFEKSAFEKTQKWISALDTNLEYFEIDILTSQSNLNYIQSFEPLTKINCYRTFGKSHCRS